MPVFVGGALGGAELMHDDEAFADGVLARRRSVRFGETAGEGETTASPVRRVRWVHWMRIGARARVVFVVFVVACMRSCCRVLIVNVIVIVQVSLERWREDACARVVDQGARGGVVESIVERGATRRTTRKD